MPGTKIDIKLSHSVLSFGSSHRLPPPSLNILVPATPKVTSETAQELQTKGAERDPVLLDSLQEQERKYALVLE